MAHYSALHYSEKARKSAENASNLVTSINNIKQEVIDAKNDAISEINKKTNVVDLTSNQTITGFKTFSNSTYFENEIMRKNDFNANINPSQIQYRIIYASDNSDSSIRAYSQLKQDTNGKLTHTIGLRKNVDGENKLSVIDLEVDRDGTTYVKTIHPSSSSNDGSISTTAWVNEKVSNLNSEISNLVSNYLPLAGGTISGDIIRKININTSSNPSTIKYILPFTVDNADSSVRAYQQVKHDTSGKITHTIGLRRLVNGENKFNVIDLETDVAGNASVKVINPPTSSNDQSVATTAWVNTFCKTTNRTIVEVYGDNTNWCRVWSDGWIEQGGIISSGTVDGSWINFSKTFYKPFTQTPSVFVNFLATQGEGYNCMKSLSATAFSFGAKSTSNNYNQNSNGITFYACGF
jgi:hypothetical protein